MARILTIFGLFEPHQRQLQFPKISNERKMIESIDSIERSRDRSDRSTAATPTGAAELGLVLRAELGRVLHAELHLVLCAEQGRYIKRIT